MTRTPDPAFTNAADAVEAALVTHLVELGDLDRAFLEDTVLQLRGLALEATDSDWGARIGDDDE